MNSPDHILTYNLTCPTCLQFVDLRKIRKNCYVCNKTFHAVCSGCECYKDAGQSTIVITIH